MRVFVPRAISVQGSGIMYDRVTAVSPWAVWPPQPVTWYVYGVDLPGERYLIDEPPYFYQTHDRPMNDCVHSKIIGQDGEAVRPNMVVKGTKSVYAERVYRWNQFYWAMDPYVPGSTWLISTAPGEVYINDRDRCQRISVSVDTTSNGIARAYATFETKVGRPKGTVTYYDCVLTRSYTIWVEMLWTLGQEDPVTRLADSTAVYTGNHSTTSSSQLPLDEEVYTVFGTLVSGLTQTWYRTGTRYYLRDTASELFPRMLEYFENLMVKWVADAAVSQYQGWTRRGYNDYGARKELELPELIPFSERFLFHEDQIVAEGLDPYLTDRHGLPNYWRNVLVQNAYLDALDSVPKLNDNSISNILEIAGFIKSLLIDHKIDIPKSLGDVWLSYRYSYTTTKLDAEEAISFVKRHRELGTLDKWISCYGTSRIHYQGYQFEADVTCRCGLDIRPSDVALLSKIWRGLYTYGLQPNFYVIWDMIPYSFIVDWLIPIGSLAHALDAQSMYSGTYYEISNVVFSLSYDIEDEYRNTYHQYTRWVQDGVPQLNGFYFLEEDPATSKVKGMRILDALSLFIGKGK